MVPVSRRVFLSEVGRGMLIAGLGTSLAKDLGFSTAAAVAEEAPESLQLGPYARLVDLLQSTPPDKLQPVLIKQLQQGETNLKQLIAAAALANAETFGGVDYVGFHTAMAMLPALQMSQLLPAPRQSLPVLKVLYRNSQQIQELGGASHKTLHALHAADHHTGPNPGTELRDACRRADVSQAEALFAPVAAGPVDQAFNVLQPAIQDDINVHRFVFAYRTYGLVGLLGNEYAHTLLRQCVRFCVDHEQMRISRKQPDPPIRTVLPRLLDQYHLAGRTPGMRDPGDAAVESLANTIYAGPPERAADAVAAALAEGIDPEVIGEAISLASNLLVLRQGGDRWRSHGDAPGVHASDATNAWRNMARVIDRPQALSGLIVAAYHTAIFQPYPTPAYPPEESLAVIQGTDPARLLAEAEDAIQQNDQARAAAAIQVYGKLGFSPQDVLETMLKYTVSEDGRLHGEKFFQTVRAEFETTRPAFRWRQLVALARVTASAYGFDRQDHYGFRAPGYEQACQLLGVPA